MIVKTRTTYDVALEQDEEKIIGNCHDALIDLASDMKYFGCNTFKCSHDDCQKTFSYEQIMSVVDFLSSLYNADINEIY